MIHVVDSSVAVKWFVREAGHQRAIAMLAPEYTLATPDFALAEIANVLWRKERIGDIESDLVADAVKMLPGFFEKLVPVSELLLDALSNARKLSHSIYDCLFLSCAEKFDEAVLVTADERFALKIRQAGLQSRLLPLSEISPSESI